MNNKNLKIIVIILSILTVGLTGYIIYDKITEKELSNINNNVENKPNISDTQEEQNNTEDNKEYTAEDFIQESALILYGPQCAGTGTGPLIAYINEDSDIVITGSVGISHQNDGSSKEKQINNIIKSTNAKYLYKVSGIACDSFKLFYINNNNELYLIDSDTIFSLSKGVKVINNKVIQFLGKEHREYEDYIKVLLEDGTVEYIKYFETAMELR